MAIQEGWHTTDDGCKLYTKTWTTEGPAKARLVFIHGFSDHINTYDYFFTTLAAKGIDVYSFDQR
jgi:acylglycerol lipase